jgi:hypothetical protein
MTWNGAYFNIKIKLWMVLPKSTMLINWYTLIRPMMWHQPLREKQIKGLLRNKKIELIKSMNPNWIDLSEGWFGDKTK